MLRYVLDTNILLYAIDGSDAYRQARAQEILRRVGQIPSAAIPVQALSEFSSVALRKFEPPVAPDELLRHVERYLLTFPVLPVTGPVVLEAIRGVRDHRFAFYDTQIWAVARLNQIPVVLSEDFSPGRIVEGVTFLNPLDATFDLEKL